MGRQDFRWVGLMRVSTTGQAEDGGGLDIQEAAIRRFVKARPPERLVKILSDAVSGTRDKLADRIALAEALAMLNRNEADGIVVHRLDRLSREVSLQETILHEVRRYRCQVASCQPGEQAALERDEPIDRAFRQMLGVFAEYERHMIIARCQAGRKRKREMGGWNSGSPPYGYEIGSDGFLRDIPHEIAAIATGRTMLANGATLDQIGEYFVACGVRLRRASRWHREVVRAVLRRAERYGPEPAPLDNLARLVMGIAADALRH